MRYHILVHEVFLGIHLTSYSRDDNADQFTCNCNLNFCYKLEMLIFQGKSKFGKDKIIGGGEVR